jgi:tRNA dimethylallyltransferase
MFVRLPQINDFAYFGGTEQSSVFMYLIVLSGPTASGKTRLAIQLAQHYNTVIISADSRQFYREMSIGTAKPDSEELAAAPHFFINSHSIESPYTVGQYEADALELLQRLSSKHELAILTGGSGLYLKAVCEGLDTFPAVPESVPKGIEADYQTYGLSYLQQELQRSDPEYYNEVDLENPRRLMRALAVCRSSGQPFSSFRKKAAAHRPFTPIYLQLQWPRAALYERINQRVDLMMEAGLLEEARALFPKRHLTALQTVGYQELFDHLAGKISLKEAVDLIKRNSRRYAKRQLTWFRRDGFWKLFQASETDSAIQFIDQSKEAGLSWAQNRTEASVQGYLLKGAEAIASFDRILIKGESLSMVKKVPAEPFTWMLWHQLQLMAVDDESAYLLTSPDHKVPAWKSTQLADLPGWAQRAVLKNKPPDAPSITFRIPE